MNIIKLYKDYGIRYWMSGKNVTSGWVNIQCPLCTDRSNHLGFDPKENKYNCWKCGSHAKTTVISRLLKISKSESKNLIQKYDGKIFKRKSTKITINKKLHFPKGTTDLLMHHRNYLIKRNFNPDKLEKTWLLKSTLPIGDYKNRIVAPVYFNNKLVSYQCRTISKKVELRYKTCKKENELHHHKHLLYGWDYKNGERAIIVEGITDVWRLGKGSLATFGTGFTLPQIKLLSEFKTLFILYDNGKPAQRQAEKIKSELLLKGNIDIELITINYDDPALMKQDDANHLMRELRL